MDASTYLTRDAAIVAVYLLVTLAVGLRYSKGITTMRQYVIGDRKRYSTAVLVATLFATLVGGGTTMGQAEKIFAFGIIWMFRSLGTACSGIVAARYMALYLDRFRKKLSVGEMMGGIYGKPAQIVTGIAGTSACVGFVGVQVGAIGYLLHYFLHLPQTWGVALACGIVVVYSASGGIRSVTATDVFQFGILITVIPLVALKAMWYAGGAAAVVANVPDTHFAVLSRNDWWKYLFIFIVMATPPESPSYVQRLLMTKDARQACHSLKIATVLLSVLACLIALAALSIAATKPTISPNLALPYAINTVLEPGLRGLGMAGLLAVIMSSADSYLHSATVSLVHDVVQPLRKYPLADNKELQLTRVATLLLGTGAMWAALSFESIIELVSLGYAFWSPIVIVPLLTGVTGSYSSTRSFVVAASCGAFTALVWQYLPEPYASVHAAIPGMLANWVALSIARQFDTSENIHYDPDDPLSGLAKRKRIELEQAHAEGKAARMTVTVAVQRVCRSAASSCWKWLLWVWGCLPIPSHVMTFCRRRTLLYHISYEKFAAATLIGCFLSYVWRNPDHTKDLFGIGLRLLCIGLAFGLLLHKHFMSHKWQKKGLPVYWLLTLVLPWHVGTLYNFLSGKGHVGDFGLWMSGVLLTAVLVDMRGFFIATVYSTLSGWLLYRLVNGQNGMVQCLWEVPVGMALSSVMNIVVVMLFARSREVSLQQQMMAYEIKEGCTAHDLPAPLNKCQQGAKTLQQHMPDLVNAHKKLSQSDSQVKPKNDKTYQELLLLPSKIDASAQRGKDFVREMLGEHRDPFKEGTQSCCSIAQCVRDALDYSDLSLEDLARIRWKGGDFLVRIRPYLMVHGVYNGLKNAAKNSPPGTIIEIWAMQEGNINVLCIHNEGGIAPHRLLAVQEIFESDTEGGHGMGLPYCRLAAQVAGGDISLTSTEELGTSLRFELPRL